MCGSDGMNINGRNALACVTHVSAVVKNNKLVLRPLPGLPVIRDLVVDMTAFYKQYEKVKPFLQNDDPPPAIERTLRVHPVRVLLHQLPVVLVES